MPSVNPKKGTTNQSNRLRRWPLNLRSATRSQIHRRQRTVKSPNRKSTTSFTCSLSKLTSIASFLITTAVATSFRIMFSLLLLVRRTQPITNSTRKGDQSRRNSFPMLELWHQSTFSSDQLCDCNSSDTKFNSNFLKNYTKH